MLLEKGQGCLVGEGAGHDQPAQWLELWLLLLLLLLLLL